MSTLVHTTGYHKGVPFDLVIEKVDGVWMSVAVAIAFQKMKIAAALDDVVLHVNSGFRSMEEQTRLFHMSPEERIQFGIGQSVAKPGFSMHQSGDALDISVRDARVLTWLQLHAARFGFKQTVSGEPWHFELTINGVHP